MTPRSYARWFTLPETSPDQSPAERIRAFRGALQAGHSEIRERFEAGADAAELVKGLSWLVDQLLRRAWQALMPEPRQLALAAVGGYGRGELLPGSDIDVLILLPEGAADRDHAPGIEAFLTFLWDIGMEVGHGVRTPAECAVQAEQDVTIITNLIESRLIAGSDRLFEAMREATSPDRLWSCRPFFEAKLKEQHRRHAKFHDTAYKLEPNIKESPGGLRDIQMVGWVAKRHFGADHLEELVTHRFLTREEYRELVEGQTFLWRIRFALHFHASRREDRLLFDYQRTLAEQFGYRDSGPQMAVELFMRDYYRTVLSLNRLNDMLLQLFKEAILHAEDPADPVPINNRFQARKGFLEVTRKNVFQKYPFALLECFLLLQQHPEVEGVRASTVRLIRARCDDLDEEFRSDLRVRSLFMEIFRQPTGLTHALRRMNRYGVLAAYLPAFGRIVGQMQFDLFHIYTVDVHTLFLIRNLRRFTVAEHANEYPLCSEIIQTIPKLELLYLAGLFHDIAKGRGGDHSELGAEEAHAFCIHHDLSEYDAKLVAWLVRHHLAMSTTAQRRDISDPAVIHEFASLVGDTTRLNYLYLLTVADIRATSPDLWNSWKDALLQELYRETKRLLRRGLSIPVDHGERIEAIKKAARQLLSKDGPPDVAVERLWARLDDDYFLRHGPHEIAWHTRKLVEAREQKQLVKLRGQTRRGGTELFIYTPAQPNLFARITAALDQLGLTVADARIITTRDHYALDTYVVMENSGEPVKGQFRTREILQALRDTLRADTPEATAVTRRAPREFRHFPNPTEIRFAPDETSGRTIVELITGDRPGLLSLVGQAFDDCGVSLENARIATFGTRAEDVFYVVNDQQQPLNEPQQTALSETLHRYLEGNAAPAAVSER
jgi:[protein-PII] uridylyltransferase